MWNSERFRKPWHVTQTKTIFGKQTFFPCFICFLWAAMDWNLFTWGTVVIPSVLPNRGQLQPFAYPRNRMEICVKFAPVKTLQEISPKQGEWLVHQLCSFGSFSYVWVWKVGLVLLPLGCSQTCPRSIRQWAKSLRPDIEQRQYSQFSELSLGIL